MQNYALILLCLWQYFKFFKQLREFPRHTVNQNFCQTLRCTFQFSQYPFYSHINRTLAVHFQNAMYRLIQNSSCFLTDQILIESQDQFKIMLPQTVLIIIFKCRRKENMFFLNIGKFLYQSIVNRLSRCFICYSVFLSLSWLFSYYSYFPFLFSCGNLWFNKITIII